MSKMVILVRWHNCPIRCFTSYFFKGQRDFATKRRPAPGSRGPASSRVSENRLRSLQHNLDVRHPYRKEVLESSPETFMQAQMYTPEVLKSENLALNCFRMVAYGLQMPELLDRYGDRAVELAATLRPDEFSKILTAFARAEYRHDNMLRAFTRHIPTRLSQFLPMDLSQTCNAFAKLRERDEMFFRRVSSEMPHKLPLFEPYQLKNVANAYARLSIRDDLLFDDIADEFLRRPQEFGGVDLYLLANAFAHFHIRHPRLWLTLGDWLLQTYLDLGAVEISVLLNSMSSVGFHHDVLLEALLRSLTQEPLIGDLDASTTTLALNALARLQWSGLLAVDGALDALADRAVDLLDDLDPASITRLLHACSRLDGLGNRGELVDGLLRCAKENVSEFNAQSLSLLVHCCAALLRRDVALLTQVAKVVPNRVADFTPQALAMTAVGFAKLEIRSEILFYLLAAEACEKMPLFTGQGVSMILRAFGRLQIKNERLVQACRKQVRALADELTMSEVDAIAAAFRSLGVLDGSTDAILRRQRRSLGTSQNVDSNPTDLWVSEEDRLLQRLADQPVKSTPRSPRHSQHLQPEQTIAAEPLPQESEGQASTDDRLDLWTLWGDSTASEERGSNISSGSASDATPSNRLREYLARPERTGRRAVDLNSSPSSVDAQPSDIDVDRPGGRKSGRRTRA